MIIDKFGDVVTKFKDTVSFDDVLLVPQYSDIESRSQVNLGCTLGDIRLSLPVISSPMDTVTEDKMSIEISKAGGIGVVHRYNSVDRQCDIISRSYYAGATDIGAAVGMGADCLERSEAVVKAGANVLCVDVAHGHHSMMEKTLKFLKDKFGNDVHIMAGNVATLEGFEALAKWGANSVRVGIGGGSICSTRLVSGHGIPTLQSVLDCSQTEYSDVSIIADGGIKTTGDMVKALAGGADFVMVGSMLAGTDASPGDTFIGKDNKKYKVYRGMASRNAQTDWRGKSSTPEGVSTTIPYKGPVTTVFENIRGGLRSGLSYSGARHLDDFRARSRFVRQTAAGSRESYTHILTRG
jgi:IMP dehydrogenase